MEFKIGDKVRYLNSKGGGEVVKILSNGMVEVNDESGFNIPFRTSELVKIQEKSFLVSDIKKTAPEKQIQSVIVSPKSFMPTVDDDIEGNDYPKLYLAFLNEPNSTGNIELHLINDCNFYFSYALCLQKNGLAEVIDVNAIEPNTKSYIKTLTKNQLQENLHFAIQGVFYKKGRFKMQQPVIKELNIPVVKFYKDGSFKDNDFFDEMAILETIIERNFADDVRKIDGNTFQKVIFSKEQQSKPALQSMKKENKAEKNFVREVDLHIHELVENEHGLTPGDKLEIQIKHFESELNNAILNHEKRIVFIHGVGNGVLKLKIKSILENQYPKLKFQDASFQKYKFGATLVIL